MSELFSDIPQTESPRAKLDAANARLELCWQELQDCTAPENSIDRLELAAKVAFARAGVRTAEQELINRDRIKQ